ncbi:hypothetical protein N658DRAFT_431977 [Parathielavia hyrcaniae]|uniref:Uncharacterized protein n=1 Tax=Parathielavia hyrcaniae TaxID=113614 RepID=A0AAN6SZ89_9PEZI|nr:hypothetical protein N658DRAFT_431977 [Parathielavia hyrcaniae]
MSKRRQFRNWESPLLIVLFFVLGLGLSLGHSAFYASLDGTEVGSPEQQENNLRLGTAAAFLAQITLGASVWQAYKLWIWRSVKKTPQKMATLNDIFGAQTSVLALLNMDMLKNFRTGYLIAMFGWSLILPPFFTPGTLFVYSSTREDVGSRNVPYLNIANSSMGHSYAFSPSENGDRFDTKNVTTRVFNGPRTVLTLLATATASQGEVLEITPPSNHSAYTVEFFGPAVQCTQANSTVQAIVSEFLSRKMNDTAETAVEVQNAYYAFVPSFDSQGNITAISAVRGQSISRAINEVWMTFERYKESTDENCDHDKYFQVCSLWNATYHLTLEFENGFQNITASRDLMHPVRHPTDKPGDVSNMAQHAYSAFFWALSDQIVGSFGQFQEPMANSSELRHFGRIQSPIQHTSLLGSSDLAVYFDFNEDRGACQIPYANLSAQRRRDIDLAKNKTMGELVEDLSVNMTISLLHNDLLTNLTSRVVTVVENVNRYGYSPHGLWIPYALSCLFTFVTVLIGIVTLIKNGSMPDTKFQDILAAADREVIGIARDPDSENRQFKVYFEDSNPIFRPHP